MEPNTVLRSIELDCAWPVATPLTNIHFIAPATVHVVYLRGGDRATHWRREKALLCLHVLAHTSSMPCDASL